MCVSRVVITVCENVVMQQFCPDIAAHTVILSEVELCDIVVFEHFHFPLLLLKIMDSA